MQESFGPQYPRMVELKNKYEEQGGKLQAMTEALRLKQGMLAAHKMLQDMLAERDTDYERFVFSTIGQAA